MFRVSTMVAVVVATTLLVTTATDANAQCYGGPPRGFGASQIRVYQSFHGVPGHRVHVGGFGAPVHSFHRSVYARPVYGVNPGIGYGWGHSSWGHSGWGHSGWGHGGWSHGGRGISIRF